LQKSGCWSSGLLNASLPIHDSSERGVQQGGKLRSRKSEFRSQCNNPSCRKMRRRVGQRNYRGFKFFGSARVRQNFLQRLENVRFKWIERWLLDYHEGFSKLSSQLHLNAFCKLGEHFSSGSRNILFLPLSIYVDLIDPSDRGDLQVDN